MTAQRSPHRLKFHVQVGGHPPSFWAREAAMFEERGLPSLGAVSAARDNRRWGPLPLATDAFPWDELGVEPRFAGDEAVGCVAALSPGDHVDTGRDEFQRYVAATKGRGEVALIVSMLGDEQLDERRRKVFTASDDSIYLPEFDGRFDARRLPRGAAAEVAPNVNRADRDLALRLKNRDTSAPWWSLTLSPVTSTGIHGTDVRHPSGELHPLLVNDLGEILAGVWLPENEDWRWYVLPGATDWQVVIRWLTDVALPEFVPASLHRVRSGELVDDRFLTSRELTARTALERFEADTERERRRLETELVEAQKAAASERFSLLYGTGKALVSAVADLLEAVGFDVEDLDETFGEGKSADLLISRASKHWLVEVKSASGRPSEGFVEDLGRHLRTWHELGRSEVIEGGLLIINHQHKLPPNERDQLPYGRPEFVSSLRHLVLPTLTLFTWWRDSDMAAIVNAIGGPARIVTAPLERRGSANPVAVADRSKPDPDVGAPRGRRLWPRSRRDSTSH